MEESFPGKEDMKQISCPNCGHLITVAAESGKISYYLCQKCGGKVAYKRTGFFQKLKGRDRIGLFDFFSRKKKVERTPALVIEHALRRKEIVVTLPEIEEVISSVSRDFKCKTCLPEEMMFSRSAEMEKTASGYTIYVSLMLAKGAGSIPQSAINTILSLAAYYACASELARRKGFSGLALKSGQRIALCDFVVDSYLRASGHPIYDLFPELLNKTVL